MTFLRWTALGATLWLAFNLLAISVFWGDPRDALSARSGVMRRAWERVAEIDRRMPRIEL